MKYFGLLLVGFLTLGSVSGFAAQEDRSVVTEVDGELYFDCSEEMASELPVETRNWVRSTTGRLLIPAAALMGMAGLPMASGGPVTAAFCPGLCPVMITAGCSPFGQSLIISALTTLTSGAGAAVGPAVVGMCTVGIGGTIASCEPICIVALGAPLWP